MYGQQCVERCDRKVKTVLLQTQHQISLKNNNQKLHYCCLFLVNGEWRYFRSCAYMGEPGIVGDERFCLMRTGTFNIFLEYCQCNSKDGCNSGHLAKPSAYTVIATLIFFVIAFVHRNL